MEGALDVILNHQAQSSEAIAEQFEIIYNLYNT